MMLQKEKKHKRTFSIEKIEKSARMKKSCIGEPLDKV